MAILYLSGKVKDSRLRGSSAVVDTASYVHHITKMVNEISCGQQIRIQVLATDQVLTTRSVADNGSVPNNEISC